MRMSVMLFSLACVSMMAGEVEKVKVASLRQALCFAGSKSEILAGLQEFNDAPLPEKVSRLKAALGANNLSTFYITYGSYGYKPEELRKCEWESAPDSVLRWQPRVRKGKSLFLPTDVLDLSWSDLDPRSAEGSFRVETDWSFKGRCLFKAMKKQDGTWQITALAVAKKGSSTFSDGIVVFDVSRVK